MNQIISFMSTTEQVATPTDFGSLETTNMYLLYIVVLLLVLVVHTFLRGAFNSLGGRK